MSQTALSENKETRISAFHSALIAATSMTDALLPELWSIVEEYARPRPAWRPVSGPNSDDEMAASTTIARSHFVNFPACTYPDVQWIECCSSMEELMNHSFEIQFSSAQRVYSIQLRFAFGDSLAYSVLYRSPGRKNPWKSRFVLSEGQIRVYFDERLDPDCTYHCLFANGRCRLVLSVWNGTEPIVMETISDMAPIKSPA